MYLQVPSLNQPNPRRDCPKPSLQLKDPQLHTEGCKE